MIYVNDVLLGSNGGGGGGGAAGASTITFTEGHSYDRAASPTPPAVFLDSDSRQYYDATATGWTVRLPTRAGSDRAKLAFNGAGITASGLDLSGYTRGNVTVAFLFYWDGGATSYEGMFGVGDPVAATHGMNFYLKVNGANLELISFQNSTETVLTTFTPASALTVGLHCFAVAPVSASGDKWRWSFDGSAAVDTAMGASYAAPASSAPLGIGLDGAGANDFHGAMVDFAVFASALSGAALAAITTLPATPTYRLPATTVPAIRAEAHRYDPSFPLVLPVLGLSAPMAVGSAVRKYEV